MTATAKRLSICLAVPTYRREQVLVDTLRQALALDPAPNEVLVIDQTPEHDPQTKQFLSAAAEAGQIRWIRQAKANLPAARNRALRETECDVVIFIDDDVVLSPAFIREHLKNYVDPKVVAVCGRVVEARPVRVAARPAQWPRELDFLHFRTDGTERVEGVSTLKGGNLSILRHVAFSLGLFDENYFGTAMREESDMALRIWKAGGLIVFEPTAELIHLGAAAGGCRPGAAGKPLAEWKRSFPENYFVARHFRGSRFFWSSILLKHVRKFVFRREHVQRPWRLPFAAVAYAYSLLLAIVAANREPVQNPAITEQLCQRSRTEAAVRAA